jgi:hypothetical protein
MGLFFNKNFVAVRLRRARKSGFWVEAYPAQHDPENPLSTLELSKTAEKPPSLDYKHYMFQVSKQKETLKPQIQHQPAKEAP